jgi:hypothetical protein
MNYSLDNPINRKVYVPEKDPGYTPDIKHNSQLDQTHRSMSWRYDNRQQVIGNQPIPESARLEKKK